MTYVFHPVVNIAFIQWDWMELEFYVNNVNWLTFFLFDAYGSVYLMTGLIEKIVGFSATGHFLINVLLRAFAAISIFQLASFWTENRKIGFVAGLFFAIGFPGIESTTWVIVFYAYVAVIQLMICLYFFKKYHQAPTSKNFKYLAISLGAAAFFSHIRLHTLPILVIIGEMYEKHLRHKHFGLLFTVTLVIFILSNLTHLTAPAFAIIPPQILLTSLFLGYPPIIHSIFLFIGNIIIPYPIIGFFNNFNLFKKPEDLLVVTIVMSFVSLLFLLTSLLKKNRIASMFSLLAAFYPVSLYLTRSNLDWDTGRLFSTTIGGSVFFLMLVIILHIRRKFPKEGELGLVGILVMLSQLFIPWLAFPLADSNIQAPYQPSHRYFLVPLAGISLIWAILTIRAPKILSLFLILILFIPNIIASRDFVNSRVQILSKSEDLKFWQKFKPIFESFSDRQTQRLVFFEGDLSVKDKQIINEILPHHLLNELGYQLQGNQSSVNFTDNKETVREFLENNSVEHLLAFRIAQDNFVDIKELILKEVKK